LQVTLHNAIGALAPDSLLLGDDSASAANKQHTYLFSSSCAISESTATDTLSSTPALQTQYSFLRTQKVFAGADKRQYLQFCKEYLGEKKNMYTLKLKNDNPRK